MKWIGIGGSMVAVLIALFAVGASSASATVLCEVSENPCGGEGYGQGTTIEASLSTGTTAVLVAGFGTVECSGSEIKGKVEKAGGESGEVVSGSITTLSFSSCNCTVTTLTNGSLEISYTSSGNGTLVGKSSVITATCSGVSCKFGTASTGTTLGTVNGGSSATLKAEAKLPWASGDSSNFVCTLGSGTGSFTATYAVNAPKPLFVEEGIFVPTVTAAPVKGGAILNFKGMKKGEFTEIEITNTDFLRTAYVTAQTVDATENDFKINVAGSTCVIGNEKTLGPREKCFVRVEFFSGVANQKGKYTLKYGTFLFPQIKTASVEIES